MANHEVGPGAGGRETGFPWRGTHWELRVSWRCRVNWGIGAGRARRRRRWRDARLFSRTDDIRHGVSLTGRVGSQVGVAGRGSVLGVGIEVLVGVNLV